MTFSEGFIAESTRVLGAIDPESVERCASGLAEVRQRGGRLFVLGVGGSAGHASHAVNDFRKICGLEAYSPVDNVSELTARINDDGWETSFSEWLKGSNLSDKDALLVFSVGGGDAERGVSANLVRALEVAVDRRCRDLRGCRARRWVHGQGRERLRRDPAVVRGPCHGAHRGPVRGHLASAGEPPGARP